MQTQNILPFLFFFILPFQVLMDQCQKIDKDKYNKLKKKKKEKIYKNIL